MRGAAATVGENRRNLITVLYGVHREELDRDVAVENERGLSLEKMGKNIPPSLSPSFSPFAAELKRTIVAMNFSPKENGKVGICNDTSLVSKAESLGGERQVCSGSVPRDKAANNAFRSLC